MFSLKKKKKIQPCELENQKTEFAATIRENEGGNLRKEDTEAEA